MYVDPNPKQLFISQNPRTRNNYFLLFLTTTTTFIYGLKIFQPPVSEKFLKSRSLNHRITEINYDT